MNYIEEYITSLKELTKGFSELEIIRYVYIDLGTHFSFDLDYHFGNKREQQEIYKHCFYNESKFNENILSGKIICKSIANILEYILNSLGINCITKIDSEDRSKCPHVYNLVKLKDGKILKFDLQLDLERIQAHLRTKYFGINEADPNESITFKEIEEIDLKIKYITLENYYADEYFYLIKSVIDYFSSLDEKVEFLLENLDVYQDTAAMGYKEFCRYFSKQLFLYLDEKEKRKIHFVDMQKSDQSYTLCIAVDLSFNKHSYYLYSREENRFIKMSEEELRDEMLHGLSSNSNVPGMKK